MNVVIKRMGGGWLKVGQRGWFVRVIRGWCFASVIHESNSSVGFDSLINAYWWVGGWVGGWV